MSVKSILKLLPAAIITIIIISLLGFMAAIAIARAMAAKTGRKIDANQELISQGMANITGTIGSSYTVSGMSSVVTLMMVVITLLFFPLPQCGLRPAIRVISD